MFDSLTLSAYAAGTTPAERAQAVRDALGSGTLTVELRDGETLVYSGTFSGPMTAGADGSLSADVLLSGAVTTGGTPDAATWNCRIRNADGRYVEGSFGPGGRFTWSGGSLVVGRAVRLRVSIAAAGAGAALPDWVPEPGMFADISLNTLASVKPAGWPSSDVAGPFLNWSSGIYASDFGAAGGYAIFGSGHLSQNTPTWAGVWVFDLDLLAWVGRNVPASPLLENSALYDGYNLSTEVATAGHAYPPHTYDGLIYRPSSLGGGTDGELVQLYSAGTSGLTYPNRVLAFDLSSTTAPPTVVIDALNSVSSNYPAAADDHARGGFWATNGNGSRPLTFTSYADWSTTTYSGVTFGTYGNASLIYVPDRDCLVSIATAGSHPNLYTAVRVCPIVGGVPQGWVTVTQGGVALPDARAGGCWSTVLGCIVTYCGTTAGDETLESGRIVYKLTIPENLVGGTWIWSTETLTGAGGATPAVGRNSSNAITNNGSWSRFVEVPSARCFLFAGSVNVPVQAWRLTGM